MASFVSKGEKDQGEKAHLTPGSISQFRISDVSLIKKYTPPANLLGVDQFNPRGLVFHEGKLYVSVTSDLIKDNLAGYIS